MANEPVITVVGNATGDCALRFLPNGTALASFTVAVTPRVKRGDEWEDGDTTFFRCSVWREQAEPAAESITKGMRLLVHGRLKTREYEKDGQTRTSVEIDVEEVGPSLRYATARVQKMARASGGNGGTRSSSSGGGPDDPWATAAPASSRSGGGSFEDEAPF